MPATDFNTDSNRGLDHVVLAVQDLQAAEARFQALGFTTTPRARHPWGTENILVQMHGSFIELLGIAAGVEMVAPKPGEFSFGHYTEDYLREQQGLSMLVFSSQDAGADRSHWLEQGLTTYAPFDFSRMATLENGQQVPVAFSLAFVSHAEMPRAAWFVCQQHYPENFWKPAFQQHANGAHGLASVTLAAREPNRYRTFLEALFSQGQLIADHQALELNLPRGQLRVMPVSELEAESPGIEDRVQRYGPQFSALEIQFDQLERVLDRLQQQRIMHTEVADRIVIPPSEVFGLTLIFSQLQ